MQRVAWKRTPSRLMAIALGVALAGAVQVAPGATGSVAAQEASPATIEQPADPFAGVIIEPLGSIVPSAATNHTLSAIRLTFEPGAEIPAHHHPGAVVLRVEEGAFGTTFVAGEGQIARASSDGTPTTEAVAAGNDVILQAGDVLTYEGAVHTMRNAGDEPLVLLASVLLATDQPAFIFQMGTPTP
jgi:quercetin dioxygenase-like cupin family protein